MVYSTDRSKAVVPMSVFLSCFVVYSTRRFVLCLSLCYFVLVFFSPFSIAITSLVEERASLGAFRTFVRFALVWFCLFPLPFGVWEGLRFVIMALPGLFSYPLFFKQKLFFLFCFNGILYVYCDIIHFEAVFRHIFMDVTMHHLYAIKINE